VSEVVRGETRAGRCRRRRLVHMFPPCDVPRGLRCPRTFARGETKS
jgi:hypothetical protein